MPRSFPTACPLLLTLVLPACGIFRGSNGDQAWLQREHLRNLYEAQATELHTALARIPDPVPMKPVRTPPAESARARFQEPQPQQPQEPVRHIDDREPVPVAREIQPLPDERRFWADAGLGDLELKYRGTGLSDRTRAVFIDAGTSPAASQRSGAGLEVSGWFTRDDLMENLTMPAPGGVRPATARVWGFDVFPHIALQPDVGPDVELPIRVGPFLGYQRAEHDDADVNRRWIDFGARAVAEPELIVGRHGDTRLGIFGRAGFDAGGTRFREQYGDRDADDTAARWMAELGAGVRLHGRHLAGELSWHWRHQETGELTSPTLGLMNEVTFTTSALFLGLVGHF
jgi:hypothetical protein